MSKYSQQFLTEFFEMYRNFTCLWTAKSAEYHDLLQKAGNVRSSYKFQRNGAQCKKKHFVKKKINKHRASSRRERNLLVLPHFCLNETFQVVGWIVSERSQFSANDSVGLRRSIVSSGIYADPINHPF